ncbi:MAG TPA: signal peptide peptidase SppA [Parabacteroides sp.]|nr:signal peptide peptidase SppA [Parabacteroides sp.]
MKQFFKTMFASVFGVLVAFGIILFGGIFFLMGMAVSSSSSSEYKPQANTVFKLTLSGIVSDQTTKDPFASLWGDDDEKLSLTEVIKAIRKAKENDNIKGIYLDVKNMHGGFASYEAIHRELLKFKESGKFIVSYGDFYEQGNYYLSSLSDSILVNPQGSINLVGLASQGVFIKDLAAKLGIEFYIFKVGTYKSAVEPYFMDKFSDANREQLTSFLGSIWNNMTAGICESRNIPHEKLTEFINSGAALDEAQVLVDNHLADKLCYRYEAENTIKRMAGQDLDDKLITADINKILSIRTHEKEKEDKIAILYAEGEIKEEDNSVMGSMDNTISEKTAKELMDLAKDDDVKAVVFRVNSPGGSAYISEQIWKAVTEVKSQKPIVVSMGDYAASGGYYISCAADKIIAERTTLTGSIGVFGVISNLAGSFKKLSVTTDVVKTNTYADLGDMSRPMRDDEKALIQRSVERTYDLFLTRCSDGRGLAKDSIDHIGQGRVWTGEQALERGLVDALGSLDDAIAEAASLANLTDYSVFKANQEKDFLSEYMDKILGEAKFSIVKSYLGEEYPFYSTIENMKSMNGIQARMPFWMQGL